MRRALFTLVTLVGALLVGEAIGIVVSWVVGAELIQRSAQFQRDQIMDGVDDPRLVRNDGPAPERLGRWSYRREVIHPYLGYVHNFDVDRDFGPPHGYQRFGFWEGTEPVHEPSPDRLVIGIFGGSVASDLAETGREALAARLGELGVLGSRRVEVHDLAFGGYKQPQQLFALTYLLAAGAYFDVVVNLDGYNEIALPPLNNVCKGVSILYPKDWYFRVQTVLAPELQEVEGRIAFLRDARQRWAGLFSRAPWRFSAVANLVWRSIDRNLAWRIIEQQVHLQGWTPGKRSFAISGPVVEYADTHAMYEALADLWQRSSVQMQRLCVANRIRYLHLLQPNQYVEGSKPMNGEERRIALRKPETSVLGPAFAALQRRKGELLGAGVDFHDMTMIFGDVEQPVYRDACCHLNELGNTLLARSVAEVIADRLRNE